MKWPLTLRRIAMGDQGLNKDGRISIRWARRKIKNPRTSEAVKKKLRFFLNVAVPAIRRRR